MKILTILFILYCLSNLIYHIFVYKTYDKIIKDINIIKDDEIVNEKEFVEIKNKIRSIERKIKNEKF